MLKLLWSILIASPIEYIFNKIGPKGGVVFEVNEFEYCAKCKTETWHLLSNGKFVCEICKATYES